MITSQFMMSSYSTKLAISRLTALDFKRLPEGPNDGEAPEGTFWVEPDVMFSRCHVVEAVAPARRRGGIANSLRQCARWQVDACAATFHMALGGGIDPFIIGAVAEYWPSPAATFAAPRLALECEIGPLVRLLASERRHIDLYISDGRQGNAEALIYLYGESEQDIARLESRLVLAGWHDAVGRTVSASAFRTAWHAGLAGLPKSG